MVRASRAARLLGHPLVIALFSAILAAIVLPILTRGWQDRQKELELKRGLVAQIAETTTVAVRSGIVAIQVGGEEDQARARREWLVQRSITTASITTYFPRLADCWFSYSDAITAFLELHGSGKTDRHVKKLSEVQELLRTTRSTCAWDEGLPQAEIDRLEVLEGRLTADFTQKPVTKIVSDLGQVLLIARDGIVRQIVDADARGFAHGLL